MPTEEKMDNSFKLNKEEVIEQFKLGNKLNVYTTLSGNKSYNYLPEPELKPRFIIVEKYRLSSFLGQYGAGRTIKTFSLLPGEKTSISVSSYKKTSSSSTKASSILDSYTEEKADEFESSVMDENSSTESKSTNFEYHAETEAKGSWGVASVSASGGVSGGTNSAREEFAKNVSSSVQNHAASSSAKRDVEINETFEVSQESGEEMAISRQIENINVSRTMNVTTRQMNQQFISLLHLVDVRVAFFNGYAESKEEVPLSKIGALVEKYVVPQKRALVRKTIENQVLSTLDYQDNKVIIAEELTPTGEEKDKYIRFKKDLISNYKDLTTGAEFSVPGVIMSADTNVMRTDGVMLEALLGQSEALDDYSKNLQMEKVKERQLLNQSKNIENIKMEAALDILKSKDEKAAKLFDLMFNEKQSTDSSDG